MFFELFHFWSVCFGVQTLMVVFLNYLLDGVPKGKR